MGEIIDAGANELANRDGDPNEEIALDAFIAMLVALAIKNKNQNGGSDDLFIALGGIIFQSDKELGLACIKALDGALNLRG
jgi:hypothetical protein